MNFAGLVIGLNLATAASLTLGQPQPVGMPASRGLPLSIVPPAPPGTTPTTTAFANNTGTPLPDNASTTSSIHVSTPDTYLWDLDVSISLTHPNCGELNLKLLAPDGRVVTLSTDNGTGIADAFAATTFDDSAHSTASSFAFTAGADSGWITPEGAFGSLIGMDPTGDWTLEMSDTAPGNVGGLASWSMSVTTLDVAPAAPTGAVLFALAPNAPIFGGGPSPIFNVSELGSQIANVQITVKIQHPIPGNLRIMLLSASGVAVELADHNGGSNVDVFHGTTFRDDARQGFNDLPAADFAYISGQPAAQLVPIGALSALLGQDPNGFWQLIVRDPVSGGTGVLEQCSLSISTWDSPAGPLNYCTTSTTTSGCNPMITYNPIGHPSLNVFNMEGNKAALFFYGINGAQYIPWSPTSTSVLCVKSPWVRSPLLVTTGTPNECNGIMSYDLGSWLAAATPPITSGTVVHVQGWFRDPPAPRSTNLTDAVQIVIP